MAKKLTYSPRSKKTGKMAIFSVKPKFKKLPLTGFFPEVKMTGGPESSADKKRSALPAGKRIAKSGSTYYETRSDRSDKITNKKRKTFKK